MRGNNYTKRSNMIKIEISKKKNMSTKKYTNNDQNRPGKGENTNEVMDGWMDENVDKKKEPVSEEGRTPNLKNIKSE